MLILWILVASLAYNQAKGQNQENVLLENIVNLNLYSASYIFPVRIAKDAVLDPFYEIHEQFVRLFNAIGFEEPKNDSLAQLLFAELTEFKHDYFSSLNDIETMFNWGVDNVQRKKKA